MPDYGYDISGTLDITPSLREVSGRQTLIEAIARRLSTPRGSLFYDPAYGFDLRQFLSGQIRDTGLIAAGVIEQAEADERVDAADAAVRFVGETLYVTVSIVAGAGPFSFTLSIDKVTAKLLLEQQQGDL